MNLCGGISIIADQDLLLQIPMEGFSLSPRKQKPSSSNTTTTTTTTTSRPANSVNEGPTTPSARKSSATPRGREQSMMMNKSTTAEIQTGSSAMLLNPVSRDDMEKLRSRQQQQQQQNHPSRGLKSSSILMKKLESGFNVVRRPLVTGARRLTRGSKGYLLACVDFSVIFCM
jgi:hypothetical protein